MTSDTKEFFVIFYEEKNGLNISHNIYYQIVTHTKTPVNKNNRYIFRYSKGFLCSFLFNFAS